MLLPKVILNSDYLYIKQFNKLDMETNLNLMGFDAN